MPRLILLAAAGLLLSACAHYPTGPSMMVLPGSGKSFTQFQSDDAKCRSWALHRSGSTSRHAATENAVGSAVVGTAVGAAAGAAIGAAAGDAGFGAALGAGSGLLLGSAAGASRAEWAGGTLQRRYDAAYMQCMYANGNQIPLALGAFATHPPPPPSGAPLRVPPPPAGVPPPPPPGAS